MQTLPIFVSLKNKNVIVIGGGDVALRKIQTLLTAQAKVTAVATHFCDDLQEMEGKQLSLIIDKYNQKYLHNVWLVIAATNDELVNRQVHDDAVAQHIFVNVVDDPPYCEFIFPAIVNRSPIIFAITSNGAAPVLARFWKQKLETLVPQWTGQLANMAGSFRQQVKQKLTKMADRRHYWERFFTGQANTLAAQGHWDKVQSVMESSLSDNTREREVFEVYYADGNPENITLKALQLMQLADVIYFDQATPNAILDLCRKDATKIKLSGNDITLGETDYVNVILKPSEYCYINLTHL